MTKCQENLALQIIENNILITVRYTRTKSRNPRCVGKALDSNGENAILALGFEEC